MKNAHNNTNFLQLRYHMFLFVADDVGDQLCERVLGVLYEIWLIACVKSFPNPTLWKTFREMCMNWRHRTGITLNSSVPDFWYGSRFADPYQWIMDPVLDPDPYLFFSGFQNANKKQVFCLLPYLLLLHLHLSVFSYIKLLISQNTCRNQGFFSSVFGLLMEGSGSGSEQIISNPDPGGPKTYPEQNTVH
jgi:hypothetical protein